MNRIFKGSSTLYGSGHRYGEAEGSPGYRGLPLGVMDRLGESLFVAKTLVEFEELLEHLGFLRVHKTHIINLAYVKTLEKNGDWKIVLKGNCSVPVSRRRRGIVTEHFKE